MDRDRMHIIERFSIVEMEKFLAIGGTLPDHLPLREPAWRVPTDAERQQARGERRFRMTGLARSRAVA